MLNIRPAILEDASTLFELVKDFATSFPVDELFFRQSLTSLLSAPSTYLVVAEEDVVIGYILGFDHHTFFANGRVSWVEEIMVRQDRRREGVGRLLMTSFERWTKARDSKLIALATRRAASFYKALGYQESATYFRKIP
jgi:GNAT superfamily N-acetyltransferase